MKLFVGNLSFQTTENDLQDAFEAFGTVTEANLMMDRATGRPRGFGFVTMVGRQVYLHKCCWSEGNWGHTERQFKPSGQVESGLRWCLFNEC